MDPKENNLPAKEYLKRAKPLDDLLKKETANHESLMHDVVNEMTKLRAKLAEYQEVYDHLWRDKRDIEEYKKNRKNIGGSEKKGLIKSFLEMFKGK